MTGVIINNNEYQVSTGNTKIEYNAMGGESVGYSMYGDEVPYTEIYEWVPYVIPSTSYSMWRGTTYNIQDNWGENITINWHTSSCLEYLFNEDTKKGSYCVINPSLDYDPYIEYITFPCDVKITRLGTYCDTSQYSSSQNNPSSYIFYDKNNNVIEEKELTSSYYNCDIICRKIGIKGYKRGYTCISEIYVTAYKQVKKS